MGQPFSRIAIREEGGGGKARDLETGTIKKCHLTY